jgi:adenylosuccinate synthase
VKSPDIVVGLQWGDEGKGKIVDAMSVDYDIVARYQGGSNAGHTIYIDDVKYVLHSIPSGILRPNCKAVIAHGCVINPDELVQEIQMLFKAAGINPIGRLFISENAHVTTDRHLEEDKVNQIIFGSTGKGIGPTYRDKADRKGILFKEIVETYPELAPYMADTRKLLYNQSRVGNRILFEGAQAVMLDVELGTYPDVTSSPCTANYAPQGSGLPLKAFRDTKVIGVAKAYTTKVGTGEFPSEMYEGTANYLREGAQEFGATTGRPRRMGWLDIEQLKYACQVNGVTEIALTRLDTLSRMTDVCIKTNSGYIDSDLTKTMDYVSFNGWIVNGDEQTYDDLPIQLREYVEWIEEELDTPITMLGIGPNRHDVIYR